jgi:hypothetical protein
MLNIFLGRREFLHPQAHFRRELWVHEIISGPRIYQRSLVGHEATCTNRHWNSHRTVACDVYRVTAESPHPGRWVQAF